MTDIYQSPGDRLRFEILLKSLTEGSINLAVLSDHDLVLDYYGNLFEESLRARGETHIEWCSSTNSEKLVQKFNEILSEITLDQALEKDKKHAPRRFLVFRDSILMQDFELQLLARLVNGFPAGNISVILLINSAGNYKGKLEAFGKNLLQWKVETEAGEPKNKLTDWVATEPEPKPDLIEPTFLSALPTLDQETKPVSELLNIPKKTAWRVPGFGKKQDSKTDSEPQPVAASPADVIKSTPEAVEPVLSAVASPAIADTSREPKLVTSVASIESPSNSEAELFKRPAKKSIAGWVLLVLLMSIAVFALMYKDLILQEYDAFQKYLLRGTPAAAISAAEVDAVAQAASAQALASAEQAASDAADSASAALEAKTESLTSSPVETAASESVSNSPNAQDLNMKNASALDSKTDAKTVPIAQASVKNTVETKPDTISDETWVGELSASSFIVQLAAMDTQDEIRNFQRSNPLYSNARVLRARQKDSGKRYFILVAGPFESKSQADSFMRSSPLLAKGWLRSSKSMKNQFSKP